MDNLAPQSLRIRTDVLCSPLSVSHFLSLSPREAASFVSLVFLVKPLRDAPFGPHHSSSQLPYPEVCSQSVRSSTAMGRGRAEEG